MSFSSSSSKGSSLAGSLVWPTLNRYPGPQKRQPAVGRRVKRAWGLTSRTAQTAQQRDVWAPAQPYLLGGQVGQPCWV